MSTNLYDHQNIRQFIYVPFWTFIQKKVFLSYFWIHGIFHYKIYIFISLFHTKHSKQCNSKWLFQKNIECELEYFSLIRFFLLIFYLYCISVWSLQASRCYIDWPFQRRCRRRNRCQRHLPTQLGGHYRSWKTRKLFFIHSETSNTGWKVDKHPSW